ncbi:hypothetical protein H5410_056852 [Solanum commersonii]|uniref:DUF4283 domain-containing protein n=1 Tax=Solanum commersonii TaxID=4109 RepID=A0A9J5WP84_SOLCO|nr:hypothetical protein H5410_056852 [Solanum commersonii]
MEWISSIMQEASKAKGNTVRRWTKKDDFTEIYCARKFNKYGRYINLINARGKRRAVIIVPELSFNSGWSGIAEKIGRFIHSYKRMGNLETHRLVDSNTPYVDMLKSSKWTNKGRKDMPEKIINRGGGAESALIEMQTSKASNSGTSSRRGLVWRNLPVKMQWSPIVYASARGDKTSATWIRVVCLPLHFWEHHTFKAIGDFCGGENNIQSSCEKVFTQLSPIDGPKVFVEDFVVLRGAADKAVQSGAMADTRGENFRTPNVDLGLRVSSNKSLNADLGFRVSGSKSLNATLGTGPI